MVAGWVVILTVITVATLIGDYCIKYATTQPEGMASPWFVVGALLYGVPAVGWFLLMREQSLALIGVLYSASTIIILAGLGYFAFGETLAPRDWLGLALAIAAVAVMSHG